MGNYIGLACSIEGGTPVVHGVLATDTELTTLFRFATRSDDDWPLQLRTVQSAVETELKHRDIDVVVVRQMDFDSRRRLTDVTVSRLATEGVLIASARFESEHVHPLMGREIGERCGVTKDQIVASAREFVPAGYAEAGAAALAARAIAEGRP